MSEQEKRKGGGGKLSRSETVTVRLDPKLRYLAELAARKQRRTVSSFIEWAVEESLNRVYLDNNTSLADVTENLWDVDEPDRFAKLALSYEYMLTHEEQVLWKIICETGCFWKGKYDNNGDWQWSVNRQSLVFDRLRTCWDDLKKVASGEATCDILPKISKRASGEAGRDILSKSSKCPPDSFDDDIPF